MGYGLGTVLARVCVNLEWLKSLGNLELGPIVLKMIFWSQAHRLWTSITGPFGMDPFRAWC